eukprot:EG_transcript_42135
MPDTTRPPTGLKHHSAPTPALPPVPEGGGAATALEVNGGAVKLDALGPMVVGVDGTLQRIANWNAMTKKEQAATLRIIAARNRERRERLAAQQSAVPGVS